jgi:3,4-dihydroxy 2-butanone 4-phosphate synthase / GTP cyclohydrolase II
VARPGYRQAMIGGTKVAVPDRARRVAVARLPTRHGEFEMIVYEAADLKEHVALAVGPVASEEPVLVRVHSECLTGDAFGSRRCDCGEQLEDSLEILQWAGCGVLLYLRQEGRGIGLASKIQAYAFQEIGLDTIEANLVQGLPDDPRDYRIAAEMLQDLGVRRIRLLTNNPAKIVGLQGFGIKVSERVPLEMEPNGHNERYLKTKREKLNHVFEKF